MAEGVIAGMRFFRQGQSCTAGSRLFVHRSIMDSFVARLTGRLSWLLVGDPLDEASDIGAIVNRRQFDRVCGYIQDGLAQADVAVALGGLPPSSGPLADRYYVTPTVLTNVRNGWRGAQEEIFGPVVCVIPWDEEDEVIALANDNRYGLSCFVWTHDLGRALRSAHRVSAGWVQVNQGGGQVLGQSYGGYKSSGMGREFSLERHGRGLHHRDSECLGREQPDGPGGSVRVHPDGIERLGGGGLDAERVAVQAPTGFRQLPAMGRLVEQAAAHGLFQRGDTTADRTVTDLQPPRCG